MKRFRHWQDGNEEPHRVITVASDMAMTAYYEEVGMTTVTFSGVVSAQEQAGGSVTIEVTGAGMHTLTALTQANGSYSTQKDLAPGSYTVQASIAADALYKAANSDPVDFIVEKASRTITLTVTM